MGSVMGLFLKNRSLVFNLSEYGLFMVLYTNFCRINYTVLENKKSHPATVLLHFLVCVQTDSKTLAQTNRADLFGMVGFLPRCVQVLLLCGTCNVLLV